MTETAGEALERLAAARGISLSELSRLIGRNVAYLQQFVRRGTPRRLAEEDRRMLAQFLGVDEAVLGGAPREAMVAVPYLTVAAAAGTGRAAGQEAVIRAVPFTARLLRDAGVTPGGASLIEAAGESMAPTILPGDRLLVDRHDIAVPAAGAVFVVRRGDELLVKRVRRRGATLTLASDNPDHPVGTCAAGEAVLVGRVKLLLRVP